MSRVNYTNNLTVRVVSADVLKLINCLNKNDVCLENISFLDELSLQFDLSKKDYQHAEQIFNKMGCSYSIVAKAKFQSRIVALKMHPIVIIGILITMFLTLYLPTRILFVQVRGNHLVPTQQILEVISNYGISFGTSRKDVRSERVKNALIEEIPQLQWAGVNTDGCVVTITLSEKTESQRQPIPKNTVSSIVALRDGVILTCTVIRGTPLCKTGQAVIQGQRLVSGYTDCGICVQATAAEAEVLAQTKRELSVITPSSVVRRNQQTRYQRKYSIRIGKKIIKLWKDSGICDTTCVKIHNEIQLVLPGGFALPVYMIVEVAEYCDTEVVSVSNFDWVPDYSDSYIESQMIAGQIIEKSEQVCTLPGVVQLTSMYNCTEMIGQTKDEEITFNYGYD